MSSLAHERYSGLEAETLILARLTVIGRDIYDRPPDLAFYNC